MAEKLTLVAVFFNEEQKLPGFFKNVKGLADRMVVIDCKSTDKTGEICRANGAEVTVSPFRYFEPNIGGALAKVDGGFVLILDADERLSDGLKAEIKAVLSNGKPPADVYFIKRNNFLFDGFSAKSSINAYLPRLFRKGCVYWEKGMPHEPPTVKGATARLSGIFFHYAYMGVPQYVKKMEEYIFQMPVEYAKSGRMKVLSSERDGRVSFIFGSHGIRMLLLYPAFNVLNHLFRHYLILDGMRGVIYSICAGISSFLEEATYQTVKSQEKNGIKMDWNQEYPDKKQGN